VDIVIDNTGFKLFTELSSVKDKVWTLNQRLAVLILYPVWCVQVDSFCTFPLSFNMMAFTDPVPYKEMVVTHLLIFKTILTSWKLVRDNSFL